MRTDRMASPARAADPLDSVMAEPVDVSALLMLRHMQRPDKPDGVARIIMLFLAESRQRLETLRQATLRGDPQAIEQTAHALKGIAGTVGATEMCDLSTRLEQLGREGCVGGVAQLVIDLQSALDRAQPVYERLRDSA
jgi:HPt (histidine-containing phosphotransfer) domain-containing protein